MAEGLTFRFVFEDDSQPVPSEAAPGAVERSQPAGPEQEPPAPRKPVDFSQPQPRRPEPQAVSEDERQNPRPSPGRPERRPQQPTRQPEGNQPTPRNVQPDRERKPQSGILERLFAEAVGHLRGLPAIGGAIGGLAHILEPMLVAQRRIADLVRSEEQPQRPEPRRPESRKPEQPAPAPRPAEPERKPTPIPQPLATEASRPPERPNPDERFPVKPFEVPAPRPVEPTPKIEVVAPQQENPDVRFPVQPFERPAPRTPQYVERTIERERLTKETTVLSPGKESRPQINVSLPTPERPKPAPLPPATRPAEKAPAPTGFHVAGPPDKQSAIEKLVAELGPLPAGQRELSAALRPLTSLGYTLTELKRAVDEMRRREREPRPAGSAPAASAPKPRPATTPQPEQARQLPKWMNKQPGMRTIRPLESKAPAAKPTPIPAPRAPTPAPTTPLPAAGAATDAVVTAEVVPEAGAVAAGAAGGPAGIAAAIAITAAVGTATRAFGALTNSVKKVDRNFSELSGRLAPFSSQIAYAQANAAARQILTDVKNASQIGGRLADYSSARSRIDQSLQRISAAFSGVALEKITPALELIARMAENIGENSDKIEAAIELLIQTLFPLLNLSAELLKRIQQNTKPNQPKLDPNADIMGIFGGRDETLNVEGVDFGTINKPLTPKPVRGGRNNNAKRGNP